jgi:LysM repeat protein
LAKRQNLNLEKVLQELEAKGMKAKPGDSLQTIAAKNGTTPMLIYRDIKKFEVAPSGSQR